MKSAWAFNYGTHFMPKTAYLQFSMRWVHGKEGHKILLHRKDRDEVKERYHRKRLEMPDIW